MTDPLNIKTTYREASSPGNDPHLPRRASSPTPSRVLARLALHEAHEGVRQAAGREHDTAYDEAALPHGQRRELRQHAARGSRSRLEGGHDGADAGNAAHD